METLMNIWNTFKDQVVPVLITLSTTLLPVIYSMLSSKIKTVKASVRFLCHIRHRNAAHGKTVCSMVAPSL